MTYVTVRHSVRDFDQWRNAFEATLPALEESGCLSYWLLKGRDAPIQVMIFLEWSAQEQARAFFESTAFRKLVERASSVGKPEITFLEEIETRGFSSGFNARAA